MSDIQSQEQHVWCNTWWNNANDTQLPRVLLIGDSIVCGYRPYVTDSLLGIVNVDMLATSKGVCDEFFERELGCFIGQYQYKAVHFNNRLHRVDMTDENYRKGLHSFVTVLRQELPGVHLIWASSTPVTMAGSEYRLDDIKNGQVIRRNRLAHSIMKETGIEINDLYSLAVDKAEIKTEDGYHFNEDGQKILGEAVCLAIKKFI